MSKDMFNGQRRNIDAVIVPTTRRTILKAGAAAAGLGALGLTAANALAQTGASTAATATPGVCALTPELTEGPYYLPLDLVRKDITEGKAGIPLPLRITVTNSTTCEPLANAAVDIWHCDAQGAYSGVTGENPGGGATSNASAGSDTFLRGIQLTDADGVAEFTTIYPGWYQGRTVHIHVKVHVDGKTEDAAANATPDVPTYEGGHFAHTGQLFFDDAVSDQVYASGGAYGGRANDQRTRNNQDNILGDHADEPGFLLQLTPVKEGALDVGLTGTITLSVDPSATPAATGGGGPGGPGGNGGPPPQG
jgi:protocatechuate 3,4-dioxygenase beta subunit